MEKAKGRQANVHHGVVTDSDFLRVRHDLRAKKIDKSFFGAHPPFSIRHVAAERMPYGVSFKPCA